MCFVTIKNIKIISNNIQRKKRYSIADKDESESFKFLYIKI